ncbi:hypothetical protein pb186bvf_010362 [Paramecium bursaria]
MIENGGKYVTTMQMTKKLIEMFKPEQKDQQKLLKSYVPSYLKTQEKEYHIKWSPTQSPSQSKALHEFSSGDSSPCNDEDQPKFDFIGEKLAVKDVLIRTINTLTHEVRILEPTKTEKYEKIPLEWQNQKEIIIFYYNPTLEVCKDKHTLKKYLIEKFKEWPFIEFQEFLRVYIAGEPVFLIKLKDERAAKFFYFNMNNNQAKHKRYLGEQFQVGLLKKVREHQFKARVVLRFLPKQFSKDKIERILYEGKVDMRNIKSEELFEFEGCKYGVIYTIEVEIGELIDNVLTKYFYERKISQPEIQVIGDNVRISNTLKSSYKSFYQPQKNSFDQLQQLVCEQSGVTNIDHCKVYEPSPPKKRQKSPSQEKNIMKENIEEEVEHEVKHGENQDGIKNIKNEVVVKKNKNHSPYTAYSINFNYSDVNFTQGLTFNKSSLVNPSLLDLNIFTNVYNIQQLSAVLQPSLALYNDSMPLRQDYLQHLISTYQDVNHQFYQPQFLLLKNFIILFTNIILQLHDQIFQDYIYQTFQNYSQQQQKKKKNKYINKRYFNKIKKFSLKEYFNNTE